MCVYDMFTFKIPKIARNTDVTRNSQRKNEIDNEINSSIFSDGLVEFAFPGILHHYDYAFCFTLAAYFMYTMTRSNDNI